VRLDGIDKHSFRLLLQYIYSGEVRASSVEEMVNLLVSGEHIGLHGLRDLCVQQLQDHLHVRNALQMQFLAAEISCPELEGAASEIVYDEFLQVAAHSADFLALEFNQLRDLVASDRIVVDSEEEVLSAVLKWVKHDPDTRKSELPPLLSLVRMGLLPPAALERLLLLEPLLAEVLQRDGPFPECVRQVEEGTRSFLLSIRHGVLALVRA